MLLMTGVAGFLHRTCLIVLRNGAHCIPVPTDNPLLFDINISTPSVADRQKTSISISPAGECREGCQFHL